MIERIQKETLVNEAAKDALMNSDIIQVGTYLEKFKTPDITKKISLGLPLTVHYEGVNSEVIDVAKIREQIQFLYRDIDVLNKALFEIREVNVISLADFEQQNQLISTLSKRILRIAQIEKERLSNKANNSIVETFNTLFEINLLQSTVAIDTAEGIAFLPYQNDTIPLLLASETSSLLVPQDVSAEDLLNGRNWYFTANSSEDFIRAKFDVNSPVSHISVQSIGYGVRCKLTIIGSESVNESFILYGKKTIPVSLSQVNQIEIELSSTSSTLPHTCGLSLLQVFGPRGALRGELYTSTYSLPAFSEILLRTDHSTPPNTLISAYYSLDGGDWVSLPLDQPLTISQAGTNEVDIPVVSLISQGKTYSYDTSSMPTAIGEGVLEIGTNQFSLSAYRTNRFNIGNTDYIPGPNDFVPTLPCWINPSTSINIEAPVTADASVQLTTPGTAHSVLSLGNTLVGTNSCPNGPALNWIIKGKDSPFRPNHVYKFSTQVFVEDDILVNDAKYWFLQGYREANTPTYRTEQIFFGSFSLWVNDISICGSNIGETLYEDSTATTEAINGTSFTFKLNKGWNTVDIYIYYPDIPSSFSDSKSANEFLQLTLYPNVFSTETMALLGISKILSMETRESVSEFDLTWSVPSSLKYWAWSKYSTGHILFNTNTSSIIDGLNGGTSSTLPSLKLKHQTLISDDEVELELKFIFQKNNETDSSPILREFQLITK